MVGKYLTKKQAERIFKEEFSELLKSFDKPAKREAWNNFVDMLCKNDQISENQCNNWTYPSFCR